MDAVFVAMNNDWLAFGADAWQDHDSEVPSLEGFDILETLILRFFARGLTIHVRARGDEERGWTPIGVGGHLGSPRLLLARESRAEVSDASFEFDLGAKLLDRVSSDERPEEDSFAARPYDERDLGELAAEDVAWQAAYVSDWVVAVGDV